MVELHAALPFRRLLSMQEIHRPTPRVSVVMPVRNAMPFLPVAIESILNQSFRDFEFIIADDSSDDGSTECISEYAARDSRIRMLRTNFRLGPVGSSNWAAGAARAPMVARMDADDVSHPQRLERQIAILDESADVVLVGSLFELIDAEGSVLRPPDLSSLLMTQRPGCAHSSIFYRRDAFHRAGGYRAGTDYFEDRDLYLRLSQFGRLMVSSEPLISVRSSWAHSRLRDDRPTVVQQLSRSRPAPSNAKIHPDVYRTFISLALWARCPSGIRFGDLRRMNWRSVVPWLKLAVLALASQLSPGMARWGIQQNLRWRNWRHRARFESQVLHEWTPGAPGVAAVRGLS